MKKLLQLAFISAVENIDSLWIGPRIQFLSPAVKTKLLEYMLSRGKLTENRRLYFRKEFFENVDRLFLPDDNEQLTDELLNIIASSGCCLKEISLTTYSNSNLSKHGLLALLEKQGLLEKLELRTSGKLQQGVINRIKSNCLKMVTIDCFGSDSRDFVSFAINNPTITHLQLDDISLDNAECDCIFSALSDTLERLVICCHGTYGRSTCAFDGPNFVPFLEMIDTKCRRLAYLSCKVNRGYKWCGGLVPDFQHYRPLRMKSESLEVLSLESHFFSAPNLLPAGIEKLKLTLNGLESSEFFEALRTERLPNLQDLYIYLDYHLEAAFHEKWLTALFSNLGQKIVSVSNINKFVFSQMASFICYYCVNLKTLNVYETILGNGSALLPLFQDKERANRLRHLNLSIKDLCHELLSYMADNCKSLKTLKLFYCEALDDDLLTTLAINCAGKLRALYVMYCSKITDESIRAIASNCATSLERICVNGTRVGDGGISALAANCIRLKECYYDRENVCDDVKKRLQKSLGVPDKVRLI